MHKGLFQLVFSFLLFFILSSSIYAAEESLSIFSPNFFADEENIFDDINYLENEHLSFKVCTDVKTANIDAYLKCSSGDNSKLKLTPYVEESDATCYFSNSNLNESPCDDFSLEINYLTNNKEKTIKRTFKEQKESKLINHIVDNDPNTLDEINLSYYLVILQDLAGTFTKESEEVYELLKDKRDNSDKCWPSGACNVEDTAKILRNIFWGEYALTTRLLEDGRIYLQKKTQDKSSLDVEGTVNYKHEFASGDDDINCSVSIDSAESFVNRTVDSSSETSEFEFDTSVAVTCGSAVDTMTLRIFNLDAERFYEEIEEESTGIDYELEDIFCLGKSDCDFETTVSTLTVYGSTIDSFDELDFYTDTEIVLVGEDTRVGTSKVFEDAGKFLYYKEQAELLEYLKFNQNNDGSWGDGSLFDLVIPTSWSVLGIQERETSSEYVEDGKDWIYFNEPVNGWGTIEKDLLAYRAIKDQVKPYVRLTMTNSIDGTTEFEIFNPTIFDIRDITLSFSEDVNEYLAYTVDLGDLSLEEKRKFNVTLSPSFNGKAVGTMSIIGVDGKDNSIDLLSIPIAMGGTSSLKIEQNQNFTLSSIDTTINLPLSLQGSAQGTCSYTNPFTNTEESASVSNSNAQISFDNPQLLEGEFSGDVICTFGTEEIIQPYSFSVQVVEKAFLTSLEEIEMIEFDGFDLDVQSNSNESQLITARVGGNYVDILVFDSSSENFTLDPGEKTTLTFLMGDPTFLELIGEGLKGEIILSSDLGYEKRLPIVLEPTGANLNTEIEGSTVGLGWAFWLALLVLVLMILVGGLAGYRYHEMKKHQKQNNLKQGESDGNADDDLYM
jgi:hypothetical protein